jgi:integrase
VTTLIKTPKLTLHKPTGQAYVRLGGAQSKPTYLGRFGDPETEAKYHRLVAELKAGATRKTPDGEPISVAGLIVRFMTHAQTYYRDDAGALTGEVSNYRCALQPLIDLYADIPAQGLGPIAFKAVRQRMLDTGWSRPYINSQCNRIRHVFRWGVSEELIPAGVYHALQSVSGLQRGRTPAPEPAPVRPASQALIDAIRDHVSPTVWDMVRLESECGGRPQDIVRLTPSCIDRSEDVWIAELPRHKTSWRGDRHFLILGPKAQTILAPYLLRRRADEPVFSPVESAEQMRETRHAERKTPLSCGNRPGTNRVRTPRRRPDNAFTTDSYRRAVTRACEAVTELPPKLARLRVTVSVRSKRTRWETRSEWRVRLGPDRWQEVQRIVRAQRFSPNQLRHSAASRLRREHGIEIAQTFLGHKIGSSITEVYAEANLEAAKAVARAG